MSQQTTSDALTADDVTVTEKSATNNKGGEPGEGKVRAKARPRDKARDAAAFARDFKCPPHKSEGDPGFLGKGTFGRVFKAVSTMNGESYAVKEIYMHKYKTAKARELLRNEVKVLAEFGHHPNIVKLYDVYQSDVGNWLLVQEYIKGGSLFDYLSEQERGYSEYEAAAYVKQVALGLQFLHQGGIIHRDLKPENILVSEGTPGELQHLKLADFGAVKVFTTDSVEVTSTRIGTNVYAAPEVGFLKRNRVQNPAPGVQTHGYTNKVDVFSLGVCTYIMIACYHPFDPYFNLSDEEVLHRIESAKYDYNDPAWETVSAEAKDLIDNCLQPDPRKRYNIQNVLAHPWLSGSASKGKSLPLKKSTQDVLNKQSANAADPIDATDANLGNNEQKDKNGENAPEANMTEPKSCCVIS